MRLTPTNYRPLFLWKLLVLSCFSIRSAVYARPLDKPQANRANHTLQTGPAAGANLVWTTCTTGTILNSSITGTATYVFGPSDCDGNGFTAISEASGASATSPARVLIGAVSGNNVLRFDRGGSTAVFTKGHLKSTAGDLFKLTNLTVYPTNAGSQTLTITAYKGGVAVSGSTITINYVSTTPIHGTTLTTVDFGTHYNNIDEIQMTTSTSLGGVALDDIQTAVALPVAFSYFSGRAEGSQVLLNWGTALEANVKNFEIERSVDGSTFLLRGTADSKAPGGNSSSPLDYSYTDILSPVLPDVLFYRLKESDLDGKNIYSPVLKINIASGNQGLSIYPNPFRHQVTIAVESPGEDKAVIIVADLGGRRLLKQICPLQKGSNIVPLSTLSRLEKGMYLFTISTGLKKQTVALMKTE